jgi:hypothetical protein
MDAGVPCPASGGEVNGAWSLPTADKLPLDGLVFNIHLFNGIRLIIAGIDMVHDVAAVFTLTYEKQ